MKQLPPSRFPEDVPGYFHADKRIDAIERAAFKLRRVRDDLVSDVTFNTERFMVSDIHAAIAPLIALLKGEGPLPDE